MTTVTREQKKHLFKLGRRRVFHLLIEHVEALYSKEFGWFYVHICNCLDTGLEVRYRGSVHLGPSGTTAKIKATLQNMRQQPLVIKRPAKL